MRPATNPSELYTQLSYLVSLFGKDPSTVSQDLIQLAQEARTHDERHFVNLGSLFASQALNVKTQQG
jgi:hypothetical protein